MQGLSSPVQVKDPYTGSILIHVGSSCKHTGVYNVHPPRIIRNLMIDGSNKKTKKKKKRLIQLQNSALLKLILTFFYQPFL